MLQRWLDELDERNVDNLRRTDSYLQLYSYTVQHPPDEPWVLMAHLVSRNAGYLMTDLARAIARTPALAQAATNLFELLERANYLIFYDAWHHVLTARIAGVDGLAVDRSTARARTAWRRHAEAYDERRLVLDLVANEQHLIEHRVVHHPRFALARTMLAAIEASGRDKPVVMPGRDVEVRVGDFASVDARIEAGRRLYDEILVDRGVRAELFAWAQAHPHTGSRSVYGGRAGPTLREAWPVDAVLAAWPEVHAPPTYDQDATGADCPASAGDPTDR